MKTRADRRNYKNKKNSKCLKIANTVGYDLTGYRYKNKKNRYELDPNKCYRKDSRKYDSKKFFKRVSNKAVRNWHKKELKNNMEDASSCNNNKSHKIFDYWWTLF